MRLDTIRRRRGRRPGPQDGSARQDRVGWRKGSGRTGQRPGLMVIGPGCGKLQQEGVAKVINRTPLFDAGERAAEPMSAEGLHGQDIISVSQFTNDQLEYIFDV